jgi:hypothetical protein
VGGAVDVRASGVDRRVDHERREVEASVGPAVDDFSGLVDEDQVAGFD